MNRKDDNNIYVYQEDSDELFDQTPEETLNDSEDASDSDREDIEEKHKSVFLIFLEIMFSPIAGWKKIRRKKITIEEIQSGCFYPLLAILAVCQFVDYFYTGAFNLGHLVTQAVVAFVSYFLGYFCIMLLLSILLPKDASQSFESNYGKVYVTVGLSTLALFSIVTELLPMLWPVLIFLPLWTIYILYKGSKFFKLAESRELRFMVITAIVIIGVPFAIDWGLNQFLPY